MTRSPLLVTTLIAALFALPASAKDTSEAAFKSVKEDVASFRADAKKRQFRHHYEKLVQRMQQVADAHPGGAYSDDALYVAAQLLDELHAVSRLPEDLRAAAKAYARVADAYPKSNLADDALFVAAKMHVAGLSDPGTARKLCARVVAMGKAADHAPKAQQLLASLPQAPATLAATSPKANGRIDAAFAKVAQKVQAEQTPKPVPQVEVLPEAPPEGTPPRQVTALEHVRSPDESLVRMALSGKVGVVRGEVPADDKNAKRIFFDIGPAKLPKRLMKAVDVGDGVIRRVRAGQYDIDVVRLVIELEGETEPLLDIRTDPFELRLGVSLDARTEAPAHVAKAAAPKPLDIGQVKRRLGNDGAPGGIPLSAQMGLSIKRIVLDAGHGGKDTGAVGKKGTREKDIALEIAHLVKAKLKEKLPWVEVIMTRDDDTFIPLERRTEIANEAGADLFVSIHCNANPSRRVRGVETYYLNITHDRYAIRLAARENAHTSDDKSISDLQFILADLAMKSNVDESIRLGREVQSSVVGTLRQDYKDVQDLGLKHALFYVLMGARMPAILVETSFLSNRTEEARLRSGKYRESVADGVVRGVARFVESRQAFYKDTAAK
jgi:N-acetylmuramoyl-L-alanine amidase